MATRESLTFTMSPLSFFETTLTSPPQTNPRLSMNLREFSLPPTFLIV
jgi:hypothetical protein